MNRQAPGRRRAGVIFSLYGRARRIRLRTKERRSSVSGPLARRSLHSTETFGFVRRLRSFPARRSQTRRAVLFMRVVRDRSGISKISAVAYPKMLRLRSPML